MKLIEAMKKIKDLQRKAADLQAKIGVHCAHMSFETPTYGDKQRETVRGWLQAHEDLMQEILGLRLAIQRTNLATSVTIDLGGKSVTKPIAAWIHRRRDLAKLDADAWAKLTDRGLKEGTAQNSLGERMELKLIRNYDPVERDAKLELYRSEPATIDARLEVVNAVTDLIES